MAVAAAQRHGLLAVIGGTRIGLLRIDFLDVRFASVDGRVLVVDLPCVEVALGLSLRPNALRVRGGSAIASGTLEELQDIVRVREMERGGSDASSTRREIEVDGLALRWTEAVGESPRVEMRGVAFKRDARGAIDVRVESGTVRLGADGAVAFGNGWVRFERGELVAAGATTAEVALGSAPTAFSASTGSSSPADHAGGSGPSAAPTSFPVPLTGTSPPSTPASVTSAAAAPPLPARRSARRAAPSSLAPEQAQLFAIPDPGRARSLAAAVVQRIAPRVPAAAHIDVDALTLRAGAGARTVALGPGALNVVRDADAISAMFTASGRAGVPIVLQTRVPLVADADVTASFEGGPVPLSVLSGPAKERTGQLVNAADKASLSGHARVSLAGDGSRVTFNADVQVTGLMVDHPAIASVPVSDLDIAVRAVGELRKGALTLAEGELGIGAFRISARGSVEQHVDYAVASLTFAAPVANCQTLFDSIPDELLPTVRGARVAGTLGATGQLAFDTRRLDDLTLAYAVEDRCRFTDVPAALARDRFTVPFTYRVYGPDGARGERTTGPTSVSWTPLDAISPYMEVAVLTTEDGAFRRHRGFNHPAIRSAVIADIKAHRFVRGASTISMQLAKNLFLEREKTASRKLEEVILTDYLEQVFSKDELLELYLNVVEFGPDVYGVTEAAEHYFARSPGELNLGEALFLASLLPSPVRYHRMMSGGEPPAGWMRHLHQLMEVASRVGLVSPGELAEGLASSIALHQQGEPRPAPRPPAAPDRRRPSGDGDWQELE